MSELPPNGATFSVSAHLFTKTECAVLSAAEQLSQATAIANHQAGDSKRHELHIAVSFPTELATCLKGHPQASTFKQELHNLLPFGYPPQSPSAPRYKSRVGLQRPSRASGGRI